MANNVCLSILESEIFKMLCPAAEVYFLYMAAGCKDEKGKNANYDLKI